MRLNPDQLTAALGRGLAPVYLISGDEPLLAGEAADAVRAAEEVLEMGPKALVVKHGEHGATAFFSERMFSGVPLMYCDQK